ncbi:MAG: FAD-dependent thymidylate synthase [Aquificaceae bacterium]
MNIIKRGLSARKEVHIMGSDQRIVRCARVSFAKDEIIDKERDIKLISYLYKNRHASPFEHIIIAFNAQWEEYIDILKRAQNPAINIHYSEGYIWLNFRQFLNLFDLIPEDIHLALKEKLPATYSIINGKTPEEYSKDESYIREKKTAECGWVGLVDKLELNSKMDTYTFIIECPLFVARQWQRHRFGSFNELSRRYTSIEPEFYIPKALRVQSKLNKQASLEEYLPEEISKDLIGEIKSITDRALNIYNKMLSMGTAREIARGVLPLSLKTRFYWTVPRISLDNFLSLRLSESAQSEIRSLASLIMDIAGYRGLDKLTRL